MAVDVKYRISAEDATKKGVDSAKRNLDGLDGGVKSFSKSIKDSIKPLTDMRSAMQALTMGTGIALLFREGAKAVGETINAYAKHNAAFADTMKKAQDSVQALKVEIGGVIADIAGPLLDAVNTFATRWAAALRPQRLAAEAMRELAAGVLSFDVSVLDKQIAGVAERIAQVKDESSKWYNQLGRESKQYYSDELAKLDEVHAALLRQRETAVQNFRKMQSELDDLVGRIKATAKDASDLADSQTGIPLSSMYDISNSPKDPYEYMKSIGLVPTLQDLGYVLGRVTGPMDHLAEALTAFNSEAEIAQTPVGSFVPGASVPDMEDMGIQGATAGSRDASLGGVVAALSAVGDGLMSFLGAIAGASVSLQLILNPLSTIFNAMMSVLGPLLDQVLAPIVGVLVIIGQALGQILAPVIQALSPVIELLAKAFVWLYNEILVPVGNGISVVLQALMNAFKGVVNFFIRILNKLGANITELTIDAIDRQTLSPITYDDLTAAGTTTIGGAGGYTAGGNNPYGPGRGAGAQYSSPRIIHVAPGASLIKVETSALVGSGGFQDFVVMVRNELQRIEALGY